MPSRRDIFQKLEIYHIFNKTIDNNLIFVHPLICERFIDLMRYYRSTKSSLRYSKFILLPSEVRKYKEQEIHYRKYFKVDILAYCLMPNHFHLLLKETAGKGIYSLRSFVPAILSPENNYYMYLDIYILIHILRE